MRVTGLILEINGRRATITRVANWNQKVGPTGHYVEVLGFTTLFCPSVPDITACLARRLNADEVEIHSLIQPLMEDIS